MEKHKILVSGMKISGITVEVLSKYVLLIKRKDFERTI